MRDTFSCCCCCFHTFFVLVAFHRVLYFLGLHFLLNFTFILCAVAFRFRYHTLLGLFTLFLFEFFFASFVSFLFCISFLLFVLTLIHIFLVSYVLLVGSCLIYIEYLYECNACIHNTILFVEIDCARKLKKSCQHFTEFLFIFKSNYPYTTHTNTKKAAAATDTMISFSFQRHWA